MSFIEDRIASEGLTFDDVLLIPAYSEVLPREVSLGVIHKNMTIEEQAAHVRRVKRAENGMITDPVTIHKDQTVGDALQKARFTRVTGSGMVESHPHDITITKETPNYSRGE